MSTESTSTFADYLPPDAVVALHGDAHAAAQRFFEDAESRYRLLRGDKARAIGMALPATFWLVVFFLLPLVFVAVASFMSRGPGGSAIAPATLAQYERTFTVFGPVLWRSIGVALLTTVVSLGLGYPLAFYISRRRSPSARMLLLFSGTT